MCLPHVVSCISREGRNYELGVGVGRGLGSTRKFHIQQHHHHQQQQQQQELQQLRCRADKKELNFIKVLKERTNGMGKLKRRRAS